MAGRRGQIAGTWVALLCALSVWAAPAAAQSVTEFTVPTPVSQPAGITLGPDGALWFTEENGHKIGRITTGGQITEYATPTQPSAPNEITTGPDGALWFTEFGANPPKIGRLTTAGVFKEFDLPVGSGPDGITAGPDGAIWFTMNSAAKIGRITLDGSTITEYPLPGGFVPGDITPGPDGRLWFTEAEPAHKIGAIRMDGSISEYDVPGAGPSGIAASANALWFTMHLADKVGRIEPDGFPITEFGPTGAEPSGIAFGPDGALWFTETSAGRVGRMTTTGRLTEFPLPSAGEPGEIVAGPDSAMWFTQFAANKIGRIEATLGTGALPPEPPRLAITLSTTSSKPGAKAKKRCRVPRLRGLTIRKARRKLKRAGCRYRVRGRGRVVSSRPKAGRRTRATVQVRARR